MPHTTNEYRFRHPGSDPRLLCVMTRSVFDTPSKILCSSMNTWFNYGEQRLLVSSYSHTSACKYLINVSLGCIGLECLTDFKVVVELVT